MDKSEIKGEILMVRGRREAPFTTISSLIKGVTIAEVILQTLENILACCALLFI